MPRTFSDSANWIITSIFGTGRPIGRVISIRRAVRTTEKDKAVSGEPRRFEVIPRRASSVEDLIGGGFRTLPTKRNRVVCREGHMERRHVAGRDASASTSEEQENEAKLFWDVSRRFLVWNGENKERNGQKAIAPWFQLSPSPVTKTFSFLIG